MSNPKPSELIETLLMLMEEDLKGELLAEMHNICNHCRYGVANSTTCKVCPFYGSIDREETLKNILPQIKLMEILDE